MSAPAAVRISRFFSRVDHHLPTLSDDAERRRFLNEQIEAWEFRLREFEIRAAHNLPPKPADASAFDFSETIDGLFARRSKYEEVVMSSPPPDAEQIDLLHFSKVKKAPSKYIEGLEALTQVFECASCHTEMEWPAIGRTITCKCGLNMHNGGGLHIAVWLPKVKSPSLVPEKV